MRSMTRVMSLACFGVLLAGMAGLSGGCARVPKSDYDAAVAEALELRGRVSDLQAQLQECEDRHAAATPAGRGNTGFDGVGAVSLRGSDIVVTVASEVLFDSGKVELKSSAKTRLSEAARVIKAQYPGSRIRVEGYTDTDPIRKSKWGTNDRLSGERAMAVKDYLVKQGVGENQIYYAGFGSNEPKGSKAQSRRVEIVVLGGDSY